MKEFIPIILCAFGIVFVLTPNDKLKLLFTNSKEGNEQVERPLKQVQENELKLSKQYTDSLFNLIIEDAKQEKNRKNTSATFNGESFYEIIEIEHLPASATDCRFKVKNKRGNTFNFFAPCNCYHIGNRIKNKTGWYGY